MGEGIRFRADFAMQTNLGSVWTVCKVATIRTVIKAVWIAHCERGVPSSRMPITDRVKVGYGVSFCLNLSWQARQKYP